MLHKLYLINITMNLIWITLSGCTGSSTTVQHQHHLLQEDSSSVCVYFIRTKETFSDPIEIDLDGENLLTLSEGQYTSLNLKPGKYELVINSNKTEMVDSLFVTVNVSRNFIVDLKESDSIYLLFNKEKFDFWELLGKSIIDEISNPTINIPLGKHSSLQLQIGSKSYPGYGYTGKSIKRNNAVKEASKLKAVGVDVIRK